MVCTLLNGYFSAFIQVVLGVCAVSSLWVKRCLEQPKRDFVIFRYDVSKQIIGSMYAHGLNMIIAISVSAHHSSSDECVWYFVNFLMDVLLGVPLNYVFTLLFKKQVVKYNFTQLNFGDYLHSTNIINKSFILQLFCWLLIITISKCLLVLSIVLPFGDGLYSFGEDILSPISRNEDVELIFVMIVIPMGLNILQYWVQDNFLKGHSVVMNNNNFQKDDTLFYDSELSNDEEGTYNAL